MPFQGRTQPLIGCAVNSGSPRIAELAGNLGFDVVWIELEHASTDLKSAEVLCLAAEAAGAYPLIRTAGDHRDHILGALEVGARILVVPMVQDAQTAARIVQHTKFPPLGNRGFNTRSRAARFGTLPVREYMEDSNREIKLLPQIETRKAVENLDEILSTEGIDGVFIGPGDLSAELGVPGNFTDPNLMDLVSRTIFETKKRGKVVGILTSSPGLVSEARDAGVDLLVIGSDFATLIDGWKTILQIFANETESDT